MEKLELKHLAPYFPYGLKGVEYIGGELFLLCQIDLTKKYPTIWESNVNLNKQRTGCKPILRPLSDLTKEIEVNGEKFIPIEWLRNNIDKKIQFSKMGFLDYEVKGINPKLHYSIFDVYQYEIELSDILLFSEKLFEWHFDVFGLIEKGLAIDINTLNR